MFPLAFSGKECVELVYAVFGRVLQLNQLDPKIPFFRTC